MHASLGGTDDDSVTDAPSKKVTLKNQEQDQRSLIHQQIEVRRGIIRDQEAAIHRLKVQFNDLAPACILPVELLTHIFSLSVPHQSDVSHDYGKSPKPLPRLASLSHVCQRWRHVCLQTPSLWASITDCLGGRWPAVFLERSMSTPLRIDITLLSHPGPTIDLILANMHRIRAMIIYSHTRMGLVDFMDQLSSPAPLLQYAAFRSSNLGNFVTKTDTVLFGGCAPQLRSLQLLNGHPGFLKNVPPFSTIINFNSERVLSVPEVLQFLQQNPDLECLQMIDPEVNSQRRDLGSILPESRTAPILMPRLRCMSVQGLLAAQAATLLRRVHMPQLDTLSVHMRIPVVSVEETTSGSGTVNVLFDLLMSRLSAARQHMGEFQSLTLYFHPSNNFSVTARSRNPPMDIDSASTPEKCQPGSRLFHLTLEWNPWDRTVPLGMNTFYHIMDLAFLNNRLTLEKIHVLSLTSSVHLQSSVSMDLPEHRWLRYFMPLINITTLWFFNMIPLTFLLDAATPISHDAGDQSNDFLFPSLFEVRITFHNSLKKFAEWLWRDGNWLVQCLRRLATARRRGDARLVLRLEGCMMPRAMIESLGEDAWVLEDGQSLPEHAETLTCAFFSHFTLLPCL
ncbi:hypothetical protein DENSPDRAFT_841205 [Dentipellis sp. KUC8613]|nr:hypothetical protein DENSPDRAFT_841205 [Dentipellis sp. KUC8613]